MAHVKVNTCSFHVNYEVELRQRHDIEIISTGVYYDVNQNDIPAGPCYSATWDNYFPETMDSDNDVDLTLR